MKQLFFIISFLFVAFCSQAQFRLAVNGVPSWTNLGGGLYSATVTFHADLTGNSYAVAGIVDTMRLFTSRGQVFEVDSVWGKTFSQATLRVTYVSGVNSAPVGQGMVYAPNANGFVPDLPFGSTGATAQFNQMPVTYNASLSVTNEPAGSTTEIQFNLSGAFGASSLLTYSTADSSLAVNGIKIWKGRWGKLANTAVGENTLTGVTTGTGNTAIGSNALRDNTIGVANTAVGYQALLANTLGSNNCALGYRALYSTTDGGYNAAMGAQAMNANTSGGYNAAFGYHALYSNTTGNQNTAIGYQAGRYITGSSENTSATNSVFVGAATKAANVNQTNQIVIGHGATGLGDSTAVLGAAMKKVRLGNNLTFKTDQSIGAGQDNYVLTYDHAVGTVSLEAPASGAGTVTSVGLTMPTGFSVSGSPVTTAGTLAVSTTLNGPLRGNGSGFTTGNINLASEVTGTLPIGNGGTNITTYTTGDILYASATNTLAKLAAGTNGHVLTLAGGVPSWAAPAITIGTTTITGGANRQILYNNSGVIGGSNVFTQNTSTNTLEISANSSADIGAGAPFLDIKNSNPTSGSGASYNFSGLYLRAGNNSVIGYNYVSYGSNVPSGYYIGNVFDNPVYFSINGTRRAIITSTGFGVMSSGTPTEALDVTGNIKASGSFRAAAGTSSAPAYTWASDTGTGWSRISSGTVGWYTGSAEKLRLTSTGLNIGGAVTSPQWALTVGDNTGDVNSAIKVNSSGTTGFAGIVFANATFPVSDASFSSSIFKYGSTHASKANVLEINNTTTANVNLAVGGTNRVSATNTGAQITGTLSVSADGGSAITLTGRDGSEVITDVTIGAGLNLSGGTLTATGGVAEDSLVVGHVPYVSAANTIQTDPAGDADAMAYDNSLNILTVKRIKLKGGSGTTTELLGRNTSDYNVNGISVGANLTLSSNILSAKDTVFINLIAAKPGVAVTQTAGHDYYDATFLVPEYLNGFDLARVDYAMTNSTATTGSWTVGIRLMSTTNTSVTSNGCAATFNAGDVRASSSGGLTVSKNQWLYIETNTAIAGTLDGTNEGLLATLMFVK